MVSLTFVAHGFYNFAKINHKHSYVTIFFTLFPEISEFAPAKYSLAAALYNRGEEQSRYLATVIPEVISRATASRMRTGLIAVQCAVFTHCLMRLL